MKLIKSYFPDNDANVHMDILYTRNIENPCTKEVKEFNSIEEALQYLSDIINKKVKILKN